MPAGKMAAQAGHAFLEAFLASDRPSQDSYRALSVGTKVVLQASYPQILKLEAKLKRVAFSAKVLSADIHLIHLIPWALIEDSGHVLLPHFTGEPIVTALGIGLHPEAQALVKNFHPWRIVS